MPKGDGIKEELGWLKIVFGVFVAIDVSLLAWLAQNFRSSDWVLVLLSIFGVAVLTGIAVWVNRAAYRLIRELEAL